MPSAKVIAKNLIKYSNSINAPISNLKLQKLLYFAWIEYYNKNKQYLFEEEFYAWQFGPVIPTVYHEYCVYGGMPITNVDYGVDDFIWSSAITTIKEVVDKYKDYSALELVELTHKKNHAWDRVYLNGYGNRKRIDFIDIISCECN